MSAQEDAWLADLRLALQEDLFRLEVVRTFNMTKGTTIYGVQVFRGAEPNSGKRISWKKAGPLLFPPDGKKISDVLEMLASLAKEVGA